MSFPRGYALLIGVGSYIHHDVVPNLPNTSEDARQLAAILTDSQYCGYPIEQVTVLHDDQATRDGVLTALEQLVATTTADSTVFIYYAGHGHYDAPADAAERTYFLTTHETDLTPEPPSAPATWGPTRWIVPSTAISQHELITALQRLPAQRVLLLFNACHAGELHPTMDLDATTLSGLQGSNPPEQTTAAILGTGSGRIMITACRDTQVAQAGGWETTVFAHYLIKCLQGEDVANRDGTISVFDLYQTVYAKVRARVLARYHSPQEPVLTVVRGIGSFPVALYRGATSQGIPDSTAPLPQGDAVHIIDIEDRIKTFVKEENELTRNTINTGIDKLIDVIDSMQTSLTKDDKINVNDYINAKLDGVKKLAQNGEIRGLSSIVNDILLEAKRGSASADTMASIINLIGYCAFLSGDTENAEKYFKEALEYTPDSTKIIFNLASLKLLEGDAEEALQLIMNTPSTEIQDNTRTHIYIQALYDTGRHDILEKLLQEESWIKTDVAMAGALASILIKSGQYEEAKQYVERAIEADPRDPQLHLLLASSLLTPLEDILSNDFILSSELETVLKTAESSLDTAIEVYEKRGNQESLFNVLVSRASVLRLLNRGDAALVDCQQVLSKNPDHYGALEQKGRVFLKLGRLNDAIRCFEQIVNSNQPDGKYTERKKEIYKLLAITYIKTGKANKTINLIYPLLKSDSLSESNLEIAEILLIAYEESKDTQNALQMTQLIEGLWPHEVYAKVILMGHFFRQHNKEEMDRVLQEILSLINESKDSFVILKLADLCHQGKYYKETIDVLRLIIDKGKDNVYLRLYLRALIDDKQFNEALEIARFIRSVNGITPGVTDFEALILDEAGDLQQAQSLWKQLADLLPDSLDHQFQLAVFSWRQGKHDDARRQILAIPFDVVKDNPFLLLKIAEMRLFLDLPDALHFAYRARRIKSNDPEIHTWYMAFIMNTERSEHNKAPVDLPYVVLDAAVEITRNGRATYFIIIDDTPISNSFNELSIQDPRAQKLLGKKVGDHVILQESILGPEEHEVTKILSKYTYAVHQTVFLREEGVIIHPMFSVFNVTPDNMRDILLQMTSMRSNDNISEIISLYENQLLPFVTISEIIHQSILDLWIIYTNSDKFIFSATGHIDEQKQHETLLSVNKSIIIDLLALFTIVHLSIEQLVIQSFEKIFVAQALIDELLNYEYASRGPQTIGTIGVLGGALQFTKTPADYESKKNMIIDRSLKFIRTHTEVLPVLSLLEADQELLAVLGEATLASVLLAKEQQLPLYSDDLHLRMLANATWHIQGFDTQALLKSAHKSSVLQFDAYCRLTTNLIQSNYKFISINANIIIRSLETKNMQITPIVKSLFRLLEGPDCETNSAVSVISEVIRHIWLIPLPRHQKEPILDSSIVSLTTGRDRRDVIPALKARLASRFALREFILLSLFTYIDLWEVSHSNQ